MLKLLIPHIKQDSGKKWYSLYLCDCGNTKVARDARVASGYIRSCGCLQQRIRTTVNITHNESYSLLYSTWQTMKFRCSNPKSENYKYYGGRGISVCPQWVDSFETFKKDMGDKPDPTYSLDRIDVNGNYSPDNCRWASPTTQVLNRRPRK